MEIGVETIEYGGKVFTIPKLSPDDGIKFEACESSNEDHSEQINLNLVWDYKILGSDVRKPLHIGDVPESEYKSFEPLQPPLRILDMPIKFPGSLIYQLPSILSPFENTIRAIASFESKINPLHIDRYCYITIDQGELETGSVHRNKGCHVDGFQGTRINPKLPIDHSYVVSNALPTVFYLQKFDVSQLDPSKDNYFAEFDRQAKKENEWRPKPFEIVMFDAYTVHKGDEVPECEKPLKRTFLRMSYTVRIFDRLGNTHNPLFNYEWEMVARDVHSVLLKKS